MGALLLLGIAALVLSGGGGSSSTPKSTPVQPKVPVPTPDPRAPAKPSVSDGVPPPSMLQDTMSDTYRGIDWTLHANGDGTWWWAGHNPANMMDAQSDTRPGYGITYARARAELLAFISSETG